MPDSGQHRLLAIDPPDVEDQGIGGGNPDGRGEEDEAGDRQGLVVGVDGGYHTQPYLQEKAESREDGWRKG